MNLTRISIAVFFFFIGQCLLAQASFQGQLADSTLTLTKQKVTYDPTYYRLDYPNGDVPANRGVCTDVVIRAYRKLGIDLQQLVHEDMKAHFDVYPKNWGLSRPDNNIDHRRVPNLMTFFTRFGKSLAITQNKEDYQPGHIVCWNLGSGLTHIGIVVKQKMADGRHLIVHNIGAGQVLQDCLFDYKIIGHYTYK
ncbi:DUF1287 domain-containing protein [Carboxylicivirga sp. M1479]|uniref:DUF1287 domain-containing protein n=1 Tax=Carboxylicivirga sp. M1479 TaxID=2594476 RepID=UPI00117897F9|nr:DUF1287 domain-containing protein [Carboxylicivirga sp. M1479]TRX65814.1 DUF1287 domain-containing protein [Carboxylicivirga sp. M1479]